MRSCSQSRSGQARSRTSPARPRECQCGFGRSRAHPRMYSGSLPLVVTHLLEFPSGWPLFVSSCAFPRSLEANALSQARHIAARPCGPSRESSSLVAASRNMLWRKETGVGACVCVILGFSITILRDKSCKFGRWVFRVNCAWVDGKIVVNMEKRDRQLYGRVVKQNNGTIVFDCSQRRTKVKRNSKKGT